MKEMQLKAWVMEESERERVTPAAIRHRYYRGKYPGLKLRRVNPREDIDEMLYVRERILSKLTKDERDILGL